VFRIRIRGPSPALGNSACSLGCKEGHMKKNSLSVRVFALGTEEHRFWYVIYVGHWKIYYCWTCQ